MLIQAKPGARRITILVSAACLAASLLTACADEYAYGPPGPYAGVDYMAYYDDFYGPFYGGYWGPGDVFYYYDGAHRYHRDRGGHFRRQGGQGFHSIQGRAPAARGGHGGGEHDHH